MDVPTTVLRILLKPLTFISPNLWARFWWWYWERQGISREEQAQLIEEYDREHPDDSD